MSGNRQFSRCTPGILCCIVNLASIPVTSVLPITAARSTLAGEDVRIENAQVEALVLLQRLAVARTARRAPIDTLQKGQPRQSTELVSHVGASSTGGVEVKGYVPGQCVQETSQSACVARPSCRWVAHKRCMQAFFENVTTSMNNLAGLGPRFTDEPCIRLTNVMYAEGEQGEIVAIDLDIRNISQYSPINTMKNGATNAMGIVNVGGTSYVDLNITFINHETGQPITVKKAVMTVLDLDTGREDAAGMNKDQESVVIEGWSAYYLTNDTKVGIDTLHDGRLVATALQFGNALDSPQSPIDMTDDMLDHSVAFEIQHRSHFRMSLVVTNGLKGRNFMTAGFSALSMESVATGMAYVRTPPLPNESIGRGLGQDPVPGPATSSSCAQKTSEKTCVALKGCRWIAHMQCVHAFLENVSVSINNLGGLGPNFDDERCMRLTHVMHATGEDGEIVTIDFDIRNTSLYTPVNTANNGADHAMGSINVVAESHVDLNITFINHETGSPIVVKKAVISIVDLDTNRVDDLGKNKDQESVWVDDWSAYYVTNHTKVGVTALKGHKLFATALYPGTAMDNPESPINMTDEALDRSIAIEFHDRSNVELSFAVANGKKGRNFMIAGYSILSMESTVTQISYEKIPPAISESIGHGLGLDPGTHG